MSDIAFDALAGTIIGNYRLKHLFEYSQSGPIFFLHKVLLVQRPITYISLFNQEM